MPTGTAAELDSENGDGQTARMFQGKKSLAAESLRRARKLGQARAPITRSLP
jgi:hypothetical protein